MKREEHPTSVPVPLACVTPGQKRACHAAGYEWPRARSRPTQQLQTAQIRRTAPLVTRTPSLAGGPSDKGRERIGGGCASPFKCPKEGEEPVSRADRGRPPVGGARAAPSLGRLGTGSIRLQQAPPTPALPDSPSGCKEVRLQEDSVQPKVRAFFSVGQEELPGPAPGPSCHPG